MEKTCIGHLQINVDAKNVPFYKDLFNFLGWSVLFDEEGFLGMGDKNGSSLWFAGGAKDVKNDYDGPGVNHIAVSAGSPADVDESASYLKEHGVQALFETPRHRPEFCATPERDYYQVMFESPDRILFEIVYTGPRKA